MRNIKIFDTTLRDGEQTPGVHVSSSHKLEIARQLEKLGADCIEAGFPAASEGEAGTVAKISSVLKKCKVAALARCSKNDIDAAFSALKTAKNPRIHVFIATSDLHIEYKLKLTREVVLERIAESVAYAKSLCGDIEFSAEDASRSDIGFLIRAVNTAVKAGASVINIPDTVGYTTPFEYASLVAKIRAELDLTEKQTGFHVILSCHCHNDLGCASACSLAAVTAGAEQVECTVNGVGERAGNAALEEIVIGLKTRADYYDACTNINTIEIMRTSRLVSSLYGITIPPNKAIVGENAFTHESGIHQHGVMNDRRTYEIFDPNDIGLQTKSKMTLGKLSGRHAFALHLDELGYNLTKEAIDECFIRFKDYAEKKEVCDEDIMAIVNEYIDSRSPVFVLDTFQIQSGYKMDAMAMIRMGCRGIFVSEAALGDGPVDAAFNAISKMCGPADITLEEYTIKAVTGGTDALGEASVKICISGSYYTGRSVSCDIIESSIKAYINALNKWASV